MFPVVSVYLFVGEGITEYQASIPTPPDWVMFPPPGLLWIESRPCLLGVFNFVQRGPNSARKNAECQAGGWHSTETSSCSQVVDGVCRVYSLWPSDEVKTVFGLGLIFIQFFIPFLVLIICYGKIVWDANKTN